MMSVWELLLLPNIVKRKTCKPTRRPVLIGYTKWEALELLPSPHRWLTRNIIECLVGTKKLPLQLMIY